MKIYFFSLLITFSIISCRTKVNNYIAVLKNLDNEHHLCFDKGETMMLCSQSYSKQMDSLLNVVYKDLLDGYNEDQKNQLRVEERIWIKRRDKELKRIYKPVNKLRESDDFAPQDERMFAYEEEAKFVRERVLVLIDYYEKQRRDQ